MRMLSLMVNFTRDVGGRTKMAEVEAMEVAPATSEKDDSEENKKTSKTRQQRLPW